MDMCNYQEKRAFHEHTICDVCVYVMLQQQPQRYFQQAIPRTEDMIEARSKDGKEHFLSGYAQSMAVCVHFVVVRNMCLRVSNLHESCHFSFH